MFRFSAILYIRFAINIVSKINKLKRDTHLDKLCYKAHDLHHICQPIRTLEIDGKLRDVKCDVSHGTPVSL